jgi:hypothetical protein
MGPRMRLNMVLDRLSGEVTAQGRSGRRYAWHEIERAERDGDRATLDDLDHTGVGDAALVHDCPECRAALANGERPVVLEGDDLDKAIEEALAAGAPWKRRRRRGRR